MKSGNNNESASTCLYIHWDYVKEYFTNLFSLVVIRLAIACRLNSKCGSPWSEKHIEKTRANGFYKVLYFWEFKILNYCLQFMRLATLKILQTSISGKHFNARELQIYKSYCWFLLWLNTVYNLGKLFMYPCLSEKNNICFLVLLGLFWDFYGKVLLIINIKRRKQSARDYVYFCVNWLF